MSKHLAACAGLTLALFAHGGTASAQLSTPIGLDPNAARQGTTLVLSADQSLLSPNGQAARSVTVALARGMTVDTASRTQLCSRSEAARSTCPPESRIGFGRFSLDVRGYVPGADPTAAGSGGETELGWALDAFLGEPQRRGDAATVVLVGRLLGADLVRALLMPSLGTAVPSSTSTVGRLVRKSSGRYGVELQFSKLPVQLNVAAPMTATPSAFEFSLSAVRRVRENFTRRLRVRTPDGYEIRKVADHRLIGHHLFRTPASCTGSWTAQLRIGLPGGVKSSTRPITCTKTLTG